MKSQVTPGLPKVKSMTLYASVQEFDTMALKREAGQGKGRYTCSPALPMADYNVQCNKIFECSDANFSLQRPK